jgi:hypothetical protein
VPVCPGWSTGSGGGVGSCGCDGGVDRGGWWGTGVSGGSGSWVPPPWEAPLEAGVLLAACCPAGTWELEGWEPGLREGVGVTTEAGVAEEAAPDIEAGESTPVGLLGAGAGVAVGCGRPPARLPIAMVSARGPPASAVAARRATISIARASGIGRHTAAAPRCRARGWKLLDRQLGSQELSSVWII